MDKTKARMVEAAKKSDELMLRQLFLTDPMSGERLAFASEPKIEVPIEPFLGTDHLISLDAIVKILNSEIQWCHQNEMANMVTAEYRQGFIKGVEQAKGLVTKMAEEEWEQEHAGMCSFEVANKHGSKRWKVTFKMEEV
jgi:ribonucleotide reductase alpha subunit